MVRQSQKDGKDKTKPLSTSKLLSKIRLSKSSDDVLELVEQVEGADFSTFLYRLMENRQLKPKDLIQKTQIERSYFYHILSGEKKNPSRNMVLRIGLCVGVSLEDMNRLLRLAGREALYPKIRRDALLIYAIQHKQKMEQANALLLEKEEVPLYRDEKHGQTDF